MQNISSFLLSVQSRKLLEDGKILHSSAPMTDVPEMVNTRFNSSLATIIVALFFSILCGLGINALLRCRLLCRRWLMVSEPSHDMGVERAKTGINKFDLKALPVSVHSTSSPLGGLDCPICLAEFMEGERKKPSGVSRPEESARVDVTERNESVAADHIVQSFHISGDDSTVIASSSLGSIKSSDLESGNAVETRRP